MGHVIGLIIVLDSWFSLCRSAVDFRRQIDTIVRIPRSSSCGWSCPARSSDTGLPIDFHPCFPCIRYQERPPLPLRLLDLCLMLDAPRLPLPMPLCLSGLARRSSMYGPSCALDGGASASATCSGVGRLSPGCSRCPLVPAVCTIPCVSRGSAAILVPSMALGA